MTTILAVKKGNQVAIAGDGQVTMGEKVIMKHSAKKVRKLYNGQVVTGFAGSVSDAITLFEKFEKYLESAHGNLTKAAVDLTKEWRSDKVLKNLEAMLIVANKEELLVLSGTGEVIAPDYDAVAIGSGGSYAYAAALALLNNTDLSAKEIARKSLEIAGSICVFTNDHITVEEVE
ncbi:MAG: ATP-dependent protease subunit HslV [Peptococcaceae bacterium]|nr:ATP-dependent protease subunit HslV [Peptococcaceae bacterium]